MLGIRSTYGRGPRWRWAIFHLVGLAENIVNLLAFSFFMVSWRNNFLFSKFMRKSAKIV